MINKSKYKVVILESPYYNELDEEAIALFNRVLRFKIRGYKNAFGDGVVPFCDADLVGNHLLVCEVKGLRLNPIMGMKSITLEKTDFHKISFPLLSILHGSPQEEATKPILQAFCDSFREKGDASKLGYNGGYTVAPEVRKNREEATLMWDIATTFLINYYGDYGITNVAAYCSTQFKIDHFKESLGWKAIEINGEKPPLVQLHCLNNTDYKVMYCNSPSELGVKRGLKEINFWHDRLTISQNEWIDFAKKEIA